MRVETFRVELSGFRVRELPNKRSKVFVVGNFDNFKEFKTHSTDNELYGGTWDSFEVQFHYETKYSDKLDKKSFELHLFEKRLIKNARIGGIKVDLFTLACGPVHHDVMLLDKNNISVGRIEFDCIFEHVANMAVSLRDVTLCLPNDFEYERGFEVYLQISFCPDSKSDVIYKTDISKMSNAFFHWQRLSTVRRNASTKKLLATKMLIEVKARKKKKTIGVCWIKFKRIFNPLDPSAPIPFSFKLTKYIHRYHPEHQSCERSPGGRQHDANGVLKGYFIFENPPLFGQMIDGVHTENGVFRGSSQLAGLPRPAFIRNPDSPDGRYSSIGGGYYEKHFSQKGNGLSQIGNDEIEREKLDFEKELERQISDENLADNEPEPLENPKRKVTKKGNSNNKLQLHGDRPKKEIVVTGSSEEFDKENQSAVANQRRMGTRGNSDFNKNKRRKIADK